jgi:hypothetical protein
MVAVTAVLGVRHLGQVGVCLAFPVRRSWLGGAVVDGLHAGSMLGLVVADRRYCEAALADAIIATGWAVSSAVVGLAGSADLSISSDVAA